MLTPSDESVKPAEEPDRWRPRERVDSVEAPADKATRHEPRMSFWDALMRSLAAVHT